MSLQKPYTNATRGRLLLAGAALVTCAAVILLAPAVLGRVQSPSDPPPWVCAGLAAAGIALFLRDLPGFWGKAVARSAGLFLLAEAFAGGAEYFTGLDFGVDTLLFPLSLSPSALHPGRLAAGTVFAFLMIGLGLFFLNSKRAVTVLIREITAVAAITFCYFSLTGRFLTSSAASPQRETILPVVSTLVVVSGLCILFGAKDGYLQSLLLNSGPAGVFARWLMPVPLILPVVTSTIRNAGTRFHLFDATGAGRLISFLDILAAILIVWRSSSQVQAVDKLRSKAEEELRKSRDELDERVKIRTAQLQLANAQMEAEIAERRRAELDLQKANLTLTTVIETSPLGICTMDQQGVVRQRNAAAAAMLIGDRPEFDNLIQRALQGEKTTSAPVALQLQQGPATLNVWASPLLQGNGVLAGVLVIAADVSERTNLEIKMREAQKLESLGVLAGGIAHDFNNLLTGILGNASLALEDLAEGDGLRPMLDQVVSASERAAELTRQLLAYAGKGKFFLQDVNLSWLVREISALIHASVDRRVRLQLELSEELPAIEADASQMQQVIMNLVINGSEAISDTGTVTVATRAQLLDRKFIQRYLTAENLQPGLYVCLEIQDTGSGMDQETQAKIFEPFFTTKFTGRGLGLAAVQGIVRGHGGALRIESELGKGTVFRIFFPAAARQTEVMPRVESKPPLREGSGTILVIDDEPVVRHTAMSSLKMLGYEVEVVDNGSDGVEIFSELHRRVRAVLLDLTMPGLSGHETFVRLKQINPSVPVILSSGFSEAEVLERFQGKDLAGFLQKPYTSLQLREKLTIAVCQ